MRPLADGDTATVAALFDRLSPASRAARFHGPKPRLTDADLRRLAAVDRDVTLLLADARAAGFRRVEAYVEPSNGGALALLRRLLGRPELRLDGGDVLVAAPLAA